MGRLGGGHGNAHAPLDALDVVDELLDRDVGAQQRLVAHQQALDVLVAPGGEHQLLHLRRVGLLVLPDPAAQRHLHVVARRDRGDHVEAVGDGVGPERAGEAEQGGDVVLDLGRGRMLVDDRALAARIGAERDPAQHPVPGQRAAVRTVQRRHQHRVDERDHDDDDQGGNSHAHERGLSAFRVDQDPGGRLPGNTSRRMRNGSGSFAAASRRRALAFSMPMTSSMRRSRNAQVAAWSSLSSSSQ